MTVTSGGGSGKAGGAAAGGSGGGAGAVAQHGRHVTDLLRASDRRGTARQVIGLVRGGHAVDTSEFGKQPVVQRQLPDGVGRLHDVGAIVRLDPWRRSPAGRMA